MCRGEDAIPHRLDFYPVV